MRLIRQRSTYRRVVHRSKRRLRRGLSVKRRRRGGVDFWGELRKYRDQLTTNVWSSSFVLPKLDEHVLPEYTEIREQFKRDAPRIAFYDNNHRLDSTRTEWLWNYVDNWASTHRCNPQLILHWCTQTALAPSYTRALQALQCSNTEMFLLDDGKQSIVFRTISPETNDKGNEKKRSKYGQLHLDKRFCIFQKVVDSLKEVLKLSLHVVVDHTNAVTYDWKPTDDDLDGPKNMTVASLLKIFGKNRP